VRGLVMIIMALDHVRDLSHITSITQSPTDLLTTTPILFFTRFVTHFCAPTFVFLAGTSAYLSFINRNNASQSRIFLIKRGFWLFVLEFTVVNLAIFFDLGFHSFLFQVIATIGFGFIVLGLLINRSPKTIGLIGLGIIFFHNLLPLIPFKDGAFIKILLSPLFETTLIPLTSHTNLIIGYPPIPWLGIMLVGFASGKIFSMTQDIKKSVFLKIGLSALLLFAILRFINIYGDSSLWSTQKDGLFTFVSFINVTKYPPSLLFCLLTLGVMFLAIALAQRANNRFTKVATVYGKVPLFYFVVHFYLIHFLMIVMLFFQGFHWSDLNFSSGTFGRPLGVQSGVGLWAIYLIWFGVVAIMYKPCLWFGKYKADHKGWWLKYI